MSASDVVVILLPPGHYDFVDVETLPSQCFPCWELTRVCSYLSWTGQLLLEGVAVEKLGFCQNSRNLGDSKCPPNRGSSFVGLPIAKFFLRVFGE